MNDLVLRIAFSDLEPEHFARIEMQHNNTQQYICSSFFMESPLVFLNSLKQCLDDLVFNLLLLLSLCKS